MIPVKIGKIVLMLLFFLSVLVFSQFICVAMGAEMNSKIRSEDIVKDMIENKCDMKSMQACFRNINSWYVIQHCNSYDWQCHSRIQRESLNALFCDGVCTAVLLMKEKEEK